MPAGKNVTVTDGENTKDTEIQLLGVFLPVDKDASTVEGTATAGANVQCQVRDTGDQNVWRHMDADEDGTWSADFSTTGDEEGEGQTWEFMPGTSGAAQIQDEDGDSTMVDWRVPAPAFNAHPNESYVDGWDWAPNTQVTVTVVDHADEFKGQVDVMADEWGNFWADNLGCDLSERDVVTVTDGVTTKQTTVEDLIIDGIDTSFDTVTGHTTASQNLFVEVNANTNYWVVRLPPIFEGLWTADFLNKGPATRKGEWDIVKGTNGSAWVNDADGDATRIDWDVPNPRFTVGEGSMWGSDWEPGEVSVRVEGQAAVKLDDTFPVDQNGDFSLENLPIEIVPGDIVQVIQGETTKELRVVDFGVDGQDADADTVWGSAPAESVVQVEVYDTGNKWVVRWPTTSGDTWTAAFGEQGAGDQEKETWDLDKGTSGSARIEDEDADAQQVDWRVPDPAFNVFKDEQAINGWEWAPGSEVAISMTSASDPFGPPIFTETVMVESGRLVRSRHTARASHTARPENHGHARRHDQDDNRRGPVRVRCRTCEQHRHVRYDLG